MVTDMLAINARSRDINGDVHPKSDLGGKK